MIDLSGAILSDRLQLIKIGLFPIHVSVTRFNAWMRALLFSLSCGLFAGGLASAHAADGPHEADLRILAIGLHADTMPVDGFYEFACGSNGGPPRQKLADWKSFATCPPDPRGLHEVYVEFNSAGAEQAKLFKETYGETLWIDKFSGTKIAGHPVILSVLFDDGGVVRGLRAITDPRAGVDERRKAFLLRVPVEAKYGIDGWQCVTRPASADQMPVGQTYINEVCDKIYKNDRRVVVETHFFRHAGQTGLNDEGQWLPGEYDSSTRWEVWDLSIPWSSGISP